MCNIALKVGFLFLDCHLCLLFKETKPFFLVTQNAVQLHRALPEIGVLVLSWLMQTDWFPNQNNGLRVKVINPLQVPPTAEAWIAWTYADTTGNFRYELRPFGNDVGMWKDEQPTFLGKKWLPNKTGDSSRNLFGMVK